MRIANNIIFIAVVSLAACIKGWQRETRSIDSNETISDSSRDDSLEGWIKPKDREYLLNKELDMTGEPLHCCPTVVEMVEPRGGTNQDGNYVDLYANQRFYEKSCKFGVEGKPCQLMDRRLHHQSKCVQQYSFSYALVTATDNHHIKNLHPTNPPSMGSGLALDYIKVRSGCACVIYPRTKRKRSSHHKNRKNKGRSSEENAN